LQAPSADNTPRGRIVHQEMTVPKGEICRIGPKLLFGDDAGAEAENSRAAQRLR
jgi:hypothetical protein